MPVRVGRRDSEGGSQLHLRRIQVSRRRSGLRNRVRQLLNFPYGLRPEVADDLTEHERALMGFKTWETYGTSDEFGAEWVRPGKDNLGERR